MERTLEEIKDDIEWYEDAYHRAPDDPARFTIDIKLDQLRDELERVTK
jgi:hypothetical protein